ncbi:protein RESPONSE TO LOW SULFUR 3-like [Phoenix dactylifera]|uniref:Protein RESPONSE TO LOW SULFUR 3-like n=1 Tax=Phoenix dactylifera TaxID=42345 RepID=A0A8B7C4K7_PHODC|nr:protein RESPONSE TO LOW SULFUR 3-like [Phoenix dactylifera]
MAAADVEELRRRNSELEREAAEAREREVEARRELERTRERLRAVEEAEERLSVEIGELEAEAVVQARDYLLRIKALSDQLTTAHDILTSAGFHHNLVALNRSN